MTSQKWYITLWLTTDISFDSMSAPISNCFFRIKRQGFGKTLTAHANLEVKVLGTVLKMQYDFIKGQIFEE